MDLDTMNWDDYEALNELGKTIAEQDRQTLIDNFKAEMAMPLPDKDLEARSKAIEGRQIAIRNIQTLNAILGIGQENPIVESAPLREETDKYEPEFLIDKWMPANRLTILTGPGGTGKSYLALQHVCGLGYGNFRSLLERLSRYIQGDVFREVERIS